VTGRNVNARHVINAINRYGRGLVPRWLAAKEPPAPSTPLETERLWHIALIDAGYMFAVEDLSLS
jgi:hypothetical protein